MKAPQKNQSRTNQSKSNQSRTTKKFPKDKPLDTAPKNEVKEMFLQWFKKHNSVGQIMSKQDVVSNVIAKLDAKQNDALKKAMDELINNGFIDVQDDGLTLVLTQRGSDFIRD